MPLRLLRPIAHSLPLALILIGDLLPALIKDGHGGLLWRGVRSSILPGPGVAKVKIMAKQTLGNDSNAVGDTHHPCVEPVWRLPVHGARCRTLSLRPSLLLRALEGAFLTRTTAASLALCAIEQPHLAKKSPFARAGPYRR